MPSSFAFQKGRGLVAAGICCLVRLCLEPNISKSCLWMGCKKRNKSIKIICSFKVKSQYVCCVLHTHSTFCSKFSKYFRINRDLKKLTICLIYIVSMRLAHFFVDQLNLCNVVRVGTIDVRNHFYFHSRFKTRWNTPTHFRSLGGRPQS